MNSIFSLKKYVKSCFLPFLTCFDQLSFVRWLKLVLVFLYARFISGNLIMISLFLFFSFDKDEFDEINLFRYSLNRRKALPLVISIAFSEKIRDPFKLVIYFSFQRSLGNSRSHKLWRLLRQGVTWFALRKSEIEIELTIFNAINHQLRLSVTIATEWYLLPFFCPLTSFRVPFFRCNTYPEAKAFIQKISIALIVL